MERESYLEMFLCEDRHWWFVVKRMFIQRILNKYYGHGGDSKILEVGCGTGGNLAVLANYGNVYATELDSEAIELANSRNICVVKKGSLPDDIPFQENFDLICMLDVLEHIDDDLGTLKAVWNKLKPGGKVLITVPAYKFLWSVHDVALQHKRRYVKKQLTHLVQASGFRVIYSTYFNTLLFPMIAAVRILNNLRGKKHGTDIAMPPKVINSLLKTVFSSELLLVPRMSFPFGVSILVFAEK